MSAGAVVLTVLTAEGRRLALVGAEAVEGRSGDVILTELLPSEKPRPKKTAQSATSPKKRASILPVPRVISVSCDVAVVICTSSWLPMEAAQLFAAAGAAPASGLANNFGILEKKSTGTGKTTVVFFSTPISVKVCR